MEGNLDSKWAKKKYADTIYDSDGSEYDSDNSSMIDLHVEEEVILPTASESYVVECWHCWQRDNKRQTRGYLCAKRKGEKEGIDPPRVPIKQCTFTRDDHKQCVEHMIFLDGLDHGNQLRDHYVELQAKNVLWKSQMRIALDAAFDALVREKNLVSSLQEELENLKMEQDK